jgi:ATP-dependent Lhr-like helicase
MEHLAANGASFFGDMRNSLSLSLNALNNALAELFWAGLVTNDVFSEILRVKRVLRESDGLPDERLEITRPRSTLRSSPELAAARRAIRQVPGWSGRWSLLRTPSVLGDDRPPSETAREQAVQFLQRYGILAREVCKREGMMPWGAIGGELQRMEMRGDIRRGYFLEGFSGMQFAALGAVEKIRSVRQADERIVVLNSCDPASPYGIEEKGRTARGEGRDREFIRDPGAPLDVQRTPSTFVVLRGGVPVMVMESYGRRVRTAGDPAGADSLALRAGIGYLKRLLALPDLLKPAKEIAIELWDGERASASRAAGMLRAEGFRGGPGQSMVYDGY